jgi:hypothetical protein
MRSAHNILHLGIKELRSLVRDPIMLVLIVYAFTFSIYTAATAMPETLHKAPIAIVDEDRSALSNRIIDDFYPPYFLPPALITTAEMDARMDAGLDTFALHIPSGFQRDLQQVAGIEAENRPSVRCQVADARQAGDQPVGGGEIGHEDQVVDLPDLVALLVDGGNLHLEHEAHRAGAGRRRLAVPPGALRRFRARGW